ncbi:MAG: bifunctional adenosylcobinamide kinase/adenosylcobinamide-phosphate guanylyltransferase [Eubacteriales bacterium]
MKHMIFGGSASGKSLFAEDRTMDFPEPRIYIATMRPWDDECIKRIEKHRKQRKNKGFDTIECYGSLVDITLPKKATVLLECMGNLVANVQFGEEKFENPLEEICKNLSVLGETAENLIIVSNDVFLEEPPENEETRTYLQLLAGVTRYMSEYFDRVTEVVCGIPIDLKGGV